MKYIFLLSILLLATASKMPSILLLLLFIVIDAVSVTKNGDEWQFHEGIDTAAIAYGKVIRSMNVTGINAYMSWSSGWTILKVASNEKYSNEEQAYAAGLVEGYLTEDVIYIHSRNVYNGKEPSDHVKSQ